MIFSYGFIEDSMSSARVMFLDLDIPGDDPLRPAKFAVNVAAPGFRIFDKDSNKTGWESDFVWLIVVNEEDGLSFKFQQTNEGDQEIMSFWKDKELGDTFNMRALLESEELWDVYQLRAVCLLQDRVQRQIQALDETGDPERETTVREMPWQLAERLRKLERDMLERCLIDLEDQVSPCQTLFALVLSTKIFSATFEHPIRKYHTDLKCLQSILLIRFSYTEDSTYSV